jgi:hypothetical protein
MVLPCAVSLRFVLYGRVTTLQGGDTTTIPLQHRLRRDDRADPAMRARDVRVRMDLARLGTCCTPKPGDLDEIGALPA